MKQIESMTGQRRSNYYLVTIFMAIAVSMIVYTSNIKVGEKIVTSSENQPTDVYSKVHWDRMNRIHPGTNTRRTLSELLIDKDAGPEFSILANATLNRRSLSNYYLHGLRSSNRADYYRCNVAFLHLHKAGGSTTKQKLRQVCRLTGMGSIKMSHRNTTKAYDRFLQKGGTSKPTVFWGGFSFGICDVLHWRPCSYMTVLREPYDRIISAYFFCQRDDPSPLCGPVNPQSVSITAWAIHQGSHFFNQLLVHKDTCRDLDIRYDEFVKPYQERTKDIIHYDERFNERRLCWFRQKAILQETVTPEQRRALLDYILDHLEHWFAVIGLLEDYQSSLELFQEAYHLPFNTDPTVTRNEGEVRKEINNSQVEQLRMDLIQSQEVWDALYEDIMIYEKAKQIFKRQKEELSLLKTSGKNASDRAD